MPAAKEYRIEVVWGQISTARAEQVLAFWAAHNALTDSVARERLPQVVCLLLGPDDRVAGANSVYAEHVALVGNRRFWVYRAYLAASVPPGFHRAMAEAAHTALDKEYQGETEEPIGICLFTDAEAASRDPEALWPATGLLHAGYLADGRQVRVGYFDGARI